MNHKLNILKQLIPGLIPLIVFIVADEIWGTKIGLIVAMSIGLIELLIGWLKYQKTDKLVLLDLGLIVVMGGVSLWLDNDFFFKLKPVIIGLMMCIMLGSAAFLPGNILLDLSKRYIKNVEFNPWQQYEFKQSIKAFFIVLLLHTLLTLAVTIWGSTALWGFVSGAGLFILFGAYMTIEMIRKRIQAKAHETDEWLPLVDEDGKVLGYAPRKIVHSGSKLLHPVVHLHVMSKGKLYLQKRPHHKLVQPNKWDTAVGGHVAKGDTIEMALQRESFEEIGLETFEPKLVTQYQWESTIEKELVFCFITAHNGPLTPHPDEVEEGRFWSLDDIDQNIGKSVFTPNFEHEYQMIKKLITS